MLLKVGVRSPEVYDLQWQLKGLGYAISADGIFGKGCQRAVMAFQSSQGLPADGVVGPNTQAALSSMEPHPKYLSKGDVVNSATSLGVTPPHVMSVLSVESRGAGFIGDKPIILFERHLFYRELKRLGVDPEPIKAQYPDICNTATGGYVGGQGEWDRLQKARSIHEDAALGATSWGLFQILGMHWSFLGCASLADFVSRMSKSESEQLALFSRFVQYNEKLNESLKRQDWASFAQGYNGPNYAKNQYDVKLRNAFALHSTYWH